MATQRGPVNTKYSLSEIFVGRLSSILFHKNSIEKEPFCLYNKLSPLPRIQQGSWHAVRPRAEAAYPSNAGYWWSRVKVTQVGLMVDR